MAARTISGLPMLLRHQNQAFEMQEHGLNDIKPLKSHDVCRENSGDDLEACPQTSSSETELQSKSGLTALFFGSRINVLLLLLPFALASPYLKWGDQVTFILALVCMVPLAERVSFVTEDVAKYTNGTVGGLLSATFGNVTEIIVGFYALRSGLLRVVQLSMLGSILSNLLLVLGSALLIGGMKHEEQSFNKVAVVTNSGLLIVTVLALSLPSILDATHSGAGLHAEPPVDPWLSSKGSLENEPQGGDAPLWLSHFVAIVMLILYVFLIFFQLKTHSHLFDGEDDDEDEPGVLGLGGGIFWLAVITVFISILSNSIVDTIDGAARDLGVPILFLSGILLPIVGNATEHAATVYFAWRNKTDIALGSAVGSAVQISLFAIPSCVIMGWVLGQPMTLNFHIFETAVLLLTCIAVSLLLMDGKSHWLKGLTLIFAYLIIAASFWAHADPAKMS